MKEHRIRRRVVKENDVILRKKIGKKVEKIRK